MQKEWHTATKPLTFIYYKAIGKGVPGPENGDFFGPWNGNERHWDPKKSTFIIQTSMDLNCSLYTSSPYTPLSFHVHLSVSVYDITVKWTLLLFQNTTNCLPNIFYVNNFGLCVYYSARKNKYTFMYLLMFQVSGRLPLRRATDPL